MPQVNRPQGLVPIRHLNGSAWNGQYQQFYVPATDATAIYIGDPVKITGTSGAAGVFVSGVSVEGVATVARDTSGTTGQDTVGVVVGFAPNPAVNGPSSNVKHRAASTAAVAYVVTDPTVVYEVQEDAVTTPIASTSVFLNAALNTAAGSTTTGLSGMMIDSDTVATTAALPIKVLGLSKRVDNALSTGTTDFAKWEVMFNTGAYAPNIAGLA